MSKATDIFVGTSDLHDEDFSCLRTIFTAFYGGFLQPLQYVLGWKRIRGGNIAKPYQQGYTLVKIVPNECSRHLHAMYLSTVVDKAKLDNDAVIRRILHNPVELT